MCPTPRKNPSKGSQRGKAKKPGNGWRQKQPAKQKPKVDVEESGHLWPDDDRNLIATAEPKRLVTVKSLAEGGCTPEDIILELGLDLDTGIPY
jgi:hypothetical protein